MTDERNLRRVYAEQHEGKNGARPRPPNTSGVATVSRLPRARAPIVRFCARGGAGRAPTSRQERTSEPGLPSADFICGPIEGGVERTAGPDC